MTAPISIIPIPPPSIVPRSGAWLVAYLSDRSYDTDVQVAPDSAGAPDTAHEYSLGPFPATGAATCVFQVNSPTGTVMWARARQTRAGATPSAYTPWRRFVCTLLTGSPPAVPDGATSVGGGLMSDVGSDGSAGGASVTSQASAGGGLVPNGEFDIWKDSRFPSWEMHQDAVHLGLSQDLSFLSSGRASAKLSNPDNAFNGGWSGINTFNDANGLFNLPLRPGVTYRIKVSSAVSRIAGGQKYRLTLYTKANLSQSQEKDVAYTVVNQFVVTEWVVTIPDDAEPMSSLWIDVNRNGDATATDFWFDAVRLEEDASSTANVQQVAYFSAYSMLQNFDAEQGTAYWKNDGTNVLLLETAAPYSGTQSFKSGPLPASTGVLYIPTPRAGATPDGDGGDDALFPVSFGDEIRAVLAAKTLNGTAGNSIVITLNRYDRSKALIDTVTLFSLLNVGTSWVKSLGTQFFHVITNPSVAYVRPAVQVAAGSSTDTFYWDEVVIDRIPGLPRCRVHRGSAVAVVTATPTTLSWDAEDFDLWLCHDTVTNPSRITPPAFLERGVWELRATVEFAAGATGLRQVSILKNGTAIASRTVPVPGGGAVFSLEVSTFDQVTAAGVYYEVQVQHTQGVNLNVDAGATVTYFEAVKVG